MSVAKIDLNNLDKSNWKTYRFDEIAKNISERVDPNNTDLTVYIGLEHIDSESLHIKRHGTPDDVNGTKLRFYKGDIIFGRRRAYQRKAGIATWDGFCSAHALVLRANPDVIAPELFPFFMHSDLFMDRAVDISVGSLSPTINWGTLKHQVFILPPIELQKELLRVIAPVESIVKCNLKIVEKLETLFKCFEKKLLDSNDFESAGILDVADVKRGKFGHRPRNAPQFYGGNIPFIQTSEVVNSGKYIERYSQTLNELGLSISKMFPEGTIVMTIAANIGYVGILAFDSAFTDSLVGIQANTQLISQNYLYYYLSYKQMTIDSFATESAQKNLSIESFKSFKVRYPIDHELQKSTVKKLDSIRTKIIVAISKLDASNKLKSTIINTVF
jgi:type I restriction enzyme S subunit